MSIPFNADEVFEMADEIERNGAKFYRKAAGAAKDTGVKDELVKLAEMEDEHERTFAAMRKELSPQDMIPTAFDPDGEAALYLRAFADGHVFDPKADPSDKLTGGESPADIYSAALGLEKDSIVFYLGMREMVPARLGRDKLDGIIREEMSHIVLLNRRLKDLEK